MSSTQEKKFLQLIKFSFDLSLKVTRTYTKANVLTNFNHSLVDFLNANKHEIYHLWNNKIKCCTCTSNVLLKQNRDLNKDQFTKLFDINGNSTPGHFKKGQGNSIIQHCFCGISCNASCSLNDLDITLIHTLLRKCVQLGPDDEMWLDTIRKIRNNLAHSLSTTCFDQGRLEKWWFKLKGSVLGLAGKVQPFYADSIEDHINDLENIDVKTSDFAIQNLIKTENRKLFDQITKHENKLQQILDKQDTHAEDIKEEVIKHLKQTKDDLSIEIKRLTFPVQFHGMDTEVMPETAETIIYQRQEERTETKSICEEETNPSSPQNQYSERCLVEWRLKTPDTWRVEQIKRTLENVSGMLRQWFHIEFIYVGSLVITTSVFRHVLRDNQLLESAIHSFLEKIVEVYGINTDVPETVNVDFVVLDTTPNTEAMISEIARLTLNNDVESYTDKDLVSCKHCKKQFLCDQCSSRHKQIEALKEDNMRQTKIVQDMEMERQKLKSKSESDDLQLYTTKEQTKQKDTDSSTYIQCQKCVSNPKPALCICLECEHVMCRECTNVHITQPKSASHRAVTVAFDCDYSFQTQDIKIGDIAKLREGTLTIIDDNVEQLITCESRGQNSQCIPLPYQPIKLAVINENEVAVTTAEEKVLIVNTREKRITKEFDLQKGCEGITFKNNYLYVGCGDKSLVEVDLTGEVIRTIPLSFTPECISSDSQGRIYCTQYVTDTMYCFDIENRTVFKITNPDMPAPCDIDVDDEGYVLVICDKNVLRISPGGEQWENIIIGAPFISISSPSIFYDSKSKSIIIGLDNTVYVYELLPTN